MMKKLMTVALLLTAFVMQGWACTNLIVGKNASADGSVIVSYSADSYGMFGFLCHYPAATYPAGAMRDIYEWDTGKFLGQIKEAKQTYNVVGNINEFQVTIAETTFGGRPELVDTTAIMDYGSLIYVALQRSRTAKEAIKIMTSLVKEYGYYSSGESFTIADPNEAWIMEMIGKGPGVKGAVWVAVRIPDDCIAAHANQSRIHKFDMSDKDNCLYSPDVISFAREKGYFSGANKDFSFADAYCPLDFSGLRACEARVWSYYNMFSKATGQAYLPYVQGESKEPMPLYVKPDRKLSVRDIQQAMRDHYEGTPLDITQDLGAGPFQMPYRLSPLTFKVDGQEYFNERPISTQQSAFSFVSQMRANLPDAIGGVLWFGLDDANMTVFTPVYCNTDRIPASYAEGEGDCVTFSWNSAFWIYNWVADMIRPRYSQMVDDMRTVQNELENTYAYAQEGVESAAMKLYNENPEKAKEFLTDYTNMCAQTAVDRWKQLGEFLIVRYNDGVRKLVKNGKLVRPTTGNVAPLERPGYPEQFLKDVVKATGDRYKVKTLQ
ncbi:C69 family dipeptidase [Phocaeicola faecicola]|jgi:dipeptidase|uniref:C69 family dipeptidase n=1 Tax=Phocaeicola faecicola TaxID=2739389 RepID=UPI0015B742F7|nr:C69 family dipeptidase [Phocaeicola faecicola]MCI5744478.1 C69 family dipeptidase [Bacteroides sp.]MDD6907738.1 C69 family dipeptidase [Bacteroidaceae bacterium]MDY4871903.1 C69 family dipeptidase [Phocaeicola faecicola]